MPHGTNHRDHVVPIVLSLQATDSSGNSWAKMIGTSNDRVHRGMIIAPPPFPNDRVPRFSLQGRGSVICQSRSRPAGGVPQGIGACRSDQVGGNAKKGVLPPASSRRARQVIPRQRSIPREPASVSPGTAGNFHDHSPAAGPVAVAACCEVNLGREEKHSRAVPRCSSLNPQAQ